ncbi:alpha/beta hydrolase fold protein [Candidatus Magnetomorum sp. HK-1]|nr:alpha/beta hydrolase fold protein [Candidatus Magnetomorum sp. HK-1]
MFDPLQQDLNDGSKWLSIDGIRIRYLRKGPGKTPLVLLHGVGGSLDVWKDTIEFFSKERDVIALDFPGFGFSDKPGIRYSIHFQILKLKRFLDQLKCKEIYLAGHSMGGGIAIHFAHLFASRVKKLILVCNAGMDKKIGASLRISTMPFSGTIIELTKSSGVEQMLKDCVHDPKLITSEWVELYQRILSLPGSIYAFRSQLKSFVTLFGQEKSFIIATRGKLSQLIMPTLIIWGKEDPVIPASHAEIAKKHIQQNTLVYLDDCGHIPQFEKKDTFNELVDNFL